MLTKLMKSRQKFDINSKDVKSEETTALHKASGIGHLEVVKFLIENRALVDAKDGSGMTPLMAADRLEVIKCLIENGADIHVKSNQGLTCLHYAIIPGEYEIVKFLIENGANVNERGINEMNGTTALQLAVQQGHLDIVKLLIENAAKLDGHTECRIAIIKGYHKIGEYLIGKKRELDSEIPEEKITK